MTKLLNCSSIKYCYTRAFLLYVSQFIIIYAVSQTCQMFGVSMSQLNPTECLLKHSNTFTPYICLISQDDNLISLRKYTSIFIFFAVEVIPMRSNLQICALSESQLARWINVVPLGQPARYNSFTERPVFEFRSLWMLNIEWILNIFNINTTIFLHSVIGFFFDYASMYNLIDWCILNLQYMRIPAVLKQPISVEWLTKLLH